jgi:hypothetical protein
VIVQDLDIRPLEFLIATEEILCTVCGKTITKGMPYAVKKNIVKDTAGFKLQIENECMTACSAIRGEQYALEPGKGRPTFFHASVAELPEFAGDEHQHLKFIVKRSGAWIATGYHKILEWQAGNKEMCFIVFKDVQMQKKIFALDHKGGDFAEEYETWKTPDGFEVRRYIKNTAHVMQGDWTAALAFLAAVPKGKAIRAS